MKIRNFSVLEHRFAGLAGLFVFLKTIAISSYLALALAVVGAALLLAVGPMLGAAAASMSFLTALVLLALMVGGVFCYGLLIVGIMNLNKVAAGIMAGLIMLSLMSATATAAVRAIEFHAISTYTTVLIVICYVAYAALMLAICGQLLYVMGISSRTERIVLEARQASLLSLAGLMGVFDVPARLRHTNRYVKRTLLMMALSGVLYATLPLAITAGPVLLMNEMDRRVREYGQLHNVLTQGVEDKFGSTYSKPQISDAIRQKLAPAYDNIAKDWLVKLVLIAAPALAACLLLGAFVRRQTQKLMASRLQEIAAVDRRRPIFFLRSFDDDQIRLQPSSRSFLTRLLRLGRPAETIDTLLLEEGTALGPVVALGDPDDAGRMPFGAAREYRGDGSWLGAVEDLMHSARAIVIVLENSDGIWTEAQSLIARGYLDKTLFIIHPRYGSVHEYEPVVSRLCQIAQTSGTSTLAPLDAYARQRRPGQLIGFHTDARGRLVAYESSEFSWITAILLLRIFFRTALPQARESAQPQQASAGYARAPG